MKVDYFVDNSLFIGQCKYACLDGNYRTCKPEREEVVQ